MRLIIKFLFCVFFALAVCAQAQTTIQTRPYTSIQTSPTCSASADTELGPSWAASKAVDGDIPAASIDTGWISTTTAAPHWLALNCGSAHAINWVDYIPWRPDRHNDTVEIYVSDDGATWGSAVCTDAGEPDTFTWRKIVCSAGTHQYIKLNVTVERSGASSVNDVEFGSGTRWRAIAATNTAGTPDGTDPNGWYRDDITDGNTLTGWSSCSGCTATITIDLQTSTTFDGVALNLLGQPTTDTVSIYTSNDNITYTQWTTAATRNSAIGNDSIFLLPARKTARYVKLEGFGGALLFFVFYEFNLVTYGPYGVKPHVFVAM